MGCVGSDTNSKNTKGKGGKNTTGTNVHGTVTASNSGIRTNTAPIPEPNTYPTRNNPQENRQSGNTPSYTPFSQGYQSPQRSIVQPQTNILDSTVNANATNLNNRASKEINYVRNDVRDSRNKLDENVNRVFESRPYDSGLSASGKLANEVGFPPSSAIIQSMEQSRGKDMLNNISNNIIIPTAAPYPQKINLDWAKDIDQENFQSKFQIITIPSIDLKIS